MQFKYNVEVERASALWTSIHSENIETLSQIESRGGGLLASKEVIIKVLLNSESDALQVRSSFLEKVPWNNEFLAFIENDGEEPRYWFVFATIKTLDIKTLSDIEYLMTTASATFTDESVVWELERKN